MVKSSFFLKNFCLWMPFFKYEIENLEYLRKIISNYIQDMTCNDARKAPQAKIFEKSRFTSENFLKFGVKFH